MNTNIIKLIYRNSDLYRFNNVKMKDALIVKQYGGNDYFAPNMNHNLTIEYNNHKYIFEKSIVDDNHYILSSKDNDDCVSVIISKNGYAEIHGIGNYKSCLQDTNENVGSNLLKLTIKMLKKYKDKLKIKMITLTDNSIKACGKYSIYLSSMLVLLNGDTWYGKYGFRPIEYTSDNYRIDNFNNKKYEANKLIINKIKISDINLIKYIKLTQNDTLIKVTEHLIKEQPNMLLKQFLFNLLKDYDNTCKFFYTFYRQLYDDIGLKVFYKNQFGLIL